MTRVVIILVVWLTLTFPTLASLDDHPDYSFLWNSLSSVRVVDGYALATTDHGLLVLELDHITDRYRPVNYVLLNTQPFTAKLSDSVISVRSYANIVYFVDISDLPNLTLLGEADIGFDFYDFALRGQNLYLVTGFDGLWQYELTDYNSPAFSDSSMTGIHCTQVEIRDDELFVLDDYNGILRYDLSAGGVGEFVDCLYIPLRARSFMLADSTVVIPLEDGHRMFLGTYSQDGPVITDTVNLISYPGTVVAVDSFFISLDPDSRLMEVINTSDLSRLLISLPTNLPYDLDGAAAFTHQSNGALLLPTTDGGLSRYIIEYLWFDNTPHQAYSRPGPIVDIFLYDDRLFTGGRRNPLEVYSLEPTGQTALDVTLHGINNVGSVAHTENMFFVLSPEADNIFITRYTDNAVEIVSTVPVCGSEVRDLEVFRLNQADSVMGLLAIRPSRIDVYTVTRNWDVHQVSTAHALGTILDVIVVDSLLIFSGNNRLVHCYRIYDDYWVEHRWTISAPGALDHLVETGPRISYEGSSLPSIILGFESEFMYQLCIPAGGIPTVEYLSTLPISVANSDLGENVLYTVGDHGIGVLDLGYLEPQVTTHGGYGSQLIALDSSFLAISDGTVIHLYALDRLAPEPFASSAAGGLCSNYMSQNYPNPFNPHTSIEYTLPTPGHIEISVLNILGRQIVTLVDERSAAGTYSASWDGTDRTGDRVASGVYFYRLKTPYATETRKMMLLK